MKATSKRAELRLSQIITTFGPGAMVDLPTRSVIVGGLERWDMRDGTWKAISEPRASQLLQERLVQTGRLKPGITLGLRTPPLDPQQIGREPPGIDVTIFPCWFVTDYAEQTPTGRRRRLVPWNQLDAARFDAAPTSIDGDIEEVYIAVDGAPIASELSWLPAVEQFGEGFFLHFDSTEIGAWLSRQPVIERDEALHTGFRAWAAKKFEGKKHPPYPGAPYIMLHSLSHSLMSEVALECGYPATALKERIYALPDSAGPGRFGILIYTATAGAQGTLGGLLSVIPRLGNIIHRALDKMTICSSDPICADHQPEGQSDDRALHGAACHSCLLVAETSCEHRNLFLDRALLSETVSQSACRLFEI